MARWKRLLRKAAENMGQEKAGAAIGYSKATVSMVLADKYDGDVEAVAARVLEVFGDRDDQVPAGYKKDAVGRLVPLSMIKEMDLARDELVAEIVDEALDLHDRIRELRGKWMGDIEAFVELSAERYKAALGGAKGNVSLTTFDGRYRILQAVDERLTADERLSVAKGLIDECLTDWTKGSPDELKAIVNAAFAEGPEGQVNAKRLLALRRLNIQDERWLRAMQAIADSLQVSGSKTYVRLYERQHDGKYRQIPLGIAAI
jgi:hypothetical protein